MIAVAGRSAAPPCLLSGGGAKRPRAALPLRGPRALRSIHKPQAARGREPQVRVEAQDPAESPFLEPFLRSLFLGLGAAVLLESAHETLQFLGAAGAHAGDVRQALAALPPPLWVADHATAIACWVGFYLVEAAAIAAVLKTYAGDQTAAMPAIRRLVTLPKKMLPLRLQLFKGLLGAGTVPAAAAAVGAAPAAAPAAVPAGPASPTASAFLDSSDSEGAMAVLPKAEYPRTLPLPPAAGKASVMGQGLQLPKQKAARPARGGSNIVPMPTEGTLTERRKRQELKPGEWEPSSAGYARRQNELLARRSYLKNVWYCAALSEAVQPGKPTSVHMLGRQFVLFRGEDGAVHCLDDICPHRGAPLSAGWTDTVAGHTCVRCPYHGWAVSPDGRVRDVPAAESAQEWPQRPIVPAFPVEERGGFIWLFYGSRSLRPEERPPIPYVPELDDPAWKPVYGEIEFDCNHHGVFENAIDMAHIHYLHSDSFGNQGQPQIKDMQTTSDAFSVSATFALHNKPVSALWEWSKVPEVHVTAKAFLPSTSVISFTLGNGLSFTTFVNTVPISANKTVNRFCLVRNLGWDETGVFNADAWDSWARKAMLRILGEDKVMVEQLRPDLLPQEFSVRADLPQIAFRKLRQQWADMGHVELNEQDKAAQQQGRGSCGDF